jgi:hypothetical protein
LFTFTASSIFISALDQMEASDVPQLEGSLEEALARAPALLQHSATQAAATRALLGRLPCEEPRGARAIALQLCAHGERSQEVRHPAARGAALQHVDRGRPRALPDSFSVPRLALTATCCLRRSSSGERRDLLPSSAA